MQKSKIFLAFLVNLTYLCPRIRTKSKMNVTQLLKELRDVMGYELDSNDFTFDFGCTNGNWGEMERDFMLSDDIEACVKFKAEGWRHVDRGDYLQPPSESGEITLSITHATFYNKDGEQVAEHDAPWPSCYDKQNTIKITF